MFLGLDLGTSSLKGLVIDEAQKPLAEASAPLAVSRPAPGWSEQNPADWIAAAETVLDQLSGLIDMAAVRGIGLSGQMHGATLLDATQEVLRPAMLWNDTRAHREAAEMDADPLWRRVTGNIPFPGFTAPKLEWVRRHEPGVFARVARVLLPKDFLRLWLTGETVSEMSDAAGTGWLDTGRRSWSEALLARSGLEVTAMPTLVEGSEISGQLRPELVRRWGFAPRVPVAGGGGDNAATGVGMGVVEPGRAFVSLGTSGVLFAATDGFAPAPETAVHTFCHALPGRWHQMGVILAAAEALAWLARLLDTTPEALTADLGPLRPPGRTLFLPYLGGERTPLNDARIRAAFLGLEHDTDRAAVTRAVLEGVALALRDCRDALAATGTDFSEILAVGGGSRSEYWLAAIATALGLPLQVPESARLGAAFGAARLGMIAVTRDPSLARPPRVKKIIEPDRSAADAFAEAHARYHAAARSLKELS